ncbi:MAG TPA: Tat pathway signal protein, partial [Puia sp.]
ALIRARIPYLPVHADHIDREAAGLSVLILPNLALMTADQVSSVKRFVEKGGSLLATGDSSLFDEWGDPLPDFALAGLFGAHLLKPRNPDMKKENKMAGDSYHTYLRLSPELRSRVDGPHNGNEPPITGERHEILEGFGETDILPFGGLLDPLRLDTGSKVLFSFIPQFPVYPPEKAWMRIPRTDIPGLILNTRENGARIVFLPADIDRQYGRSNLPDHGNLLKNIVRWAAKEDLPLSVEGAGLVDSHLYRQADRLILHLVNLTNENTWRQPLDELISIGPLRVNVKLPSGIKGTSLRLLVSGKTVNAEVRNNWCQFEINSITDHEVIVIY